jgi:FkbM family methyltransferase
MKLVKKINRKFFKILFPVIDNLLPFIRSRKYLGFTLYYSKGTSLLEGLRNDLYEPETCNIIHRVLGQIDYPTFIDIGSNIGLMSLFVLSKNPSSRVYAFEPGPHQSGLLCKTIKKNKLENNLLLETLAISNSESYLDFFIHKTKDVSGDGFIDTQRAGETKSIKVQTKRLDVWWNEHDNPHIDMIKIDTEGAELWVLEGASELIKTCRPYILTEICKLNYYNYPYSEFEVLEMLHHYNYIVYNENGVVINKENLSVFQNEGLVTYFCEPNSALKSK